MDFIVGVIYVSIYLGIFSTTFYILSFMEDRRKEKKYFSDSELPKVSVIIPVYNEEKSIAKTLKSILASDYPRGLLEVIVVNDASTDNSLKEAMKFKSKVKILDKKENSGSKAAAFNYGFSKATGQVVISMDADTTVPPETVKRMVRYFKNKDVMAVTPAMILIKSKGILERVQHVEYLMGLFLRKAFAAVNSIYITPGAFTVYRKSFMDKYGVYELDNITEDLEMALRIQSKGYVVENCPEAPAYTIPMDNFWGLLVQRRRWYFGLLQNFVKYKFMIGNKKYGDLGAFVIPIAIISIALAVIVTGYFFIKVVFDIKKEINFLQSVNFDFPNIYDFNYYILERLVYHLLSNPIVLFVILFVFVLVFYLYYAQKKVGKSWELIINVPLFFALFAILFAFWWMVSLFYFIFVGKVKWR